MIPSPYAQCAHALQVAKVQRTFVSRMLRSTNFNYLLSGGSRLRPMRVLCYFHAGPMQFPMHTLPAVIMLNHVGTVQQSVCKDGGYAWAYMSAQAMRLGSNRFNRCMLAHRRMCACKPCILAMHKAKRC